MDRDDKKVKANINIFEKKVPINKINLINHMTAIIKKYEKHIPKSILTISIENTHFLRDVLRAYSFISRKHAFWKIKALP